MFVILYSHRWMDLAGVRARSGIDMMRCRLDEVVVDVRVDVYVEVDEADA